MELLAPHDGLKSEPILAVVGELQFDVLQSRLESEYNVETTMQTLPFTMARWVARDIDQITKMNLPSRCRICVDAHGHSVILFTAAWELEHAQKENPDVEFLLAS